MKRECCNYCMWYGPVNKDGGMRKHYRKGDDHTSRTQVKELGACPGSNKPYATFGCEPVVEYCTKVLYTLSGGTVQCSKHAGHDKAHV